MAYIEDKQDDYDVDGNGGSVAADGRTISVAGSASPRKSAIATISRPSASCPICAPACIGTSTRRRNSPFSTMRRLRVLIVTLFGTMHMLAGKGEALTCKASAELVVFSGIDILSGAPVDASASLDVTCTVSSLDGTAGSLLEIHVCPGIGEGSGGSAAGTRQLVRGDGQGILNYNIYQDADRTEQWGHSSFPALGDMPTMTMIVAVPSSGSTADVSASRLVYFRLFGIPADITAWHIHVQFRRCGCRDPVRSQRMSER